MFIANGCPNEPGAPYGARHLVSLIYAPIISLRPERKRFLVRFGFYKHVAPMERRPQRLQETQKRRELLHQFPAQLLNAVSV